MDKIVHFEIPADDMKRAQKFYQTAFGWKVEAYPGFEGYYGVYTVEVDEKTRMPKQAGAINGGMLKRESPIKNPVITVNVQDIGASMKKLEAAGGKVVRGMEPVGDFGLAAYFKDTEGNILGLWQDLKKQ